MPWVESLAAHRGRLASINDMRVRGGCLSRAMDITAPRLPFLTYGTLRGGESNWAHFGLDIRSDLLGTTTLAGYAMYEASGAGYPYIVRTDDIADMVTVEVVQPHERHYDRMLTELDRLEGYGGEGQGYENHYDRIGVPYVLADGTSGEGWLYVASDWTRQWFVENRGYPRIPSGDWLNR